MTYPDRRADAGAIIKTQTTAGDSVTLRADDDGVVHVHNADQQEAADYLQLPVIKAAKADAKKPEA